MIKAISYWSLENGGAGTHSIEKALADVREAGFRGLELCVGPEGVVNTYSSQAECEAIRSQIEASGITVETVASGMAWAFNPTSDSADIRSKSIALHKSALQRTAWLGAEAMLYVPGVVKSPISPDIIRYDHALKRATDGVTQLLEVANEVRVDLCVENVWNGLFYSPIELAQFVDSFADPRLGIYFDVGNVLGYHQHPPHWIELLNKRILRVHIKDFKQSIASLDGFCDLLAGDVPFAESMAALRAVGYDSTIVAEMMPWDQAILRRTSVALDKILAL